MQHLMGRNWHSLEADEIVELFESDAGDGLGPLSIKHREEFFGKNELQEKNGAQSLKSFFCSFIMPCFIYF